MIYQYIGEEAFVVGLPARDITFADLEENPDWRAMIEANLQTPSPCYKKVQETQRKQLLPVKEGEA